MTEATKQEQYAQLVDKVQAIYDAIREAEAFADANGLSFSFSGPEYGMGGYYEGGSGWSPSSGSC